MKFFKMKWLLSALLCIMSKQAASTNCLGSDTMCDACAVLGNEWDGCEEITKSCKAEICDLLCLRTSFTCKFEFKCSGWDGCPSFLEQVKDDRVSNALCSQFKGKTCGQKGLKCCENDLQEWVEDRTYGGYFPNLPIPVEACLHDPNDPDWKGCNACKKSTFKIVDTGSHWRAPADYKEDGKQQPPGLTTKKAAQNSLTPPSDLIPDFTNLQLKHKTLLKKVKSKTFPSEDICKCLGCCEGECYYPVDSSTLMDS